MKHKFYFRFSFFSTEKKRNWTFIVVFRFFPAGKETEFDITTCSLFFFFVTFPNCIRNHVIAYKNKAVFVNFALEKTSLSSSSHNLLNILPKLFPLNRSYELYN